MSLWVFNSTFNVGRLYVKIRTQMPIIAIPLAHQVSQHLTASAVIVYQPQSHSRCKGGDVDSELFIFASPQKPVREKSSVKCMQLRISRTLRSWTWHIWTYTSGTPHSSQASPLTTVLSPHAHCTFPLLDLCSFPVPERNTISLS